MTRLERMEMAKELGYTCDFITGKVFGIRGKELKRINNGYSIFHFGNIAIRSHHFIWYMYYNEDIPDGLFIDHINQNRLDNRIENLRLVTNQENSFNCDSKGTYWHKRDKKWRSQIQVNGKKLWIGNYDTEEEARQAYLEAKEKYHQIEDRTIS